MDDNGRRFLCTSSGSLMYEMDARRSPINELVVRESL